MPPLTRLLALALTLSFAGPAYAQSAAEAERVRLSDDMKRLAGRSAWRGVDDAYEQLVTLSDKEGVVLTFRDHWTGAEAARELGDINGVHTRLQRAVAVAKPDDKERCQSWLDEIAANYSEVSLKVSNKVSGDTTLDVEEMPFAPDQRRAIEAAQAAIAGDKAYKGLLPTGSYELGTKAFEVKAGDALQQVVLEPEAVVSTGGGGGGGLAYVGPRIDLGFAFTQAGDPGADAMAARAFSGGGGRAGVGVEIGLSSTFGVVAQIGYHGLMGPAPADDGGVAAGFDARSTSMHLGYGWLGGTFRAGSLEVAAGPVYGIGVASLSGLNDYCLSASNDPACAGVVGSDGQNVQTYTPIQGSIRAAGGELGLFYGLFEFGSLQSGLGVHLGALSDASRLYPWGQLAFTLAPANRRDG